MFKDKKCLSFVLKVNIKIGGKCSFRTVDTLLVKHCDVGMRLRYEIECIGYVGLFRPRTPDSPTTFRLPAGGWAFAPVIGVR